MTPLGFAGLAGIGAIITMGWGYIKYIFSRIYGLFIVKYTTDSYTSSMPIIFKLLKDCKYPSQKYTRKVRVDSVYHKHEDRYVSLIYENLSDGLNVFWRGKIPLLVTLEHDEFGIFRSLSLIGPRKIFDHKQFIIDAVNEYDIENRRSQSELESRYRVIHRNGTAGKINSLGKDNNHDSDGDSEVPVGVGSDNFLKTCIPYNFSKSDLSISKPKNTRQCYYISEELEPIQSEIERWFHSEKWYKERGLLWKRGYLFYGAPGTGKTSFVRKVAQDLDIPIFSFDLATFRNDELVKAFMSLKRNTPCIALFEDIDAIFNGRENVTGIDGSLTFDCFLNVLDGADENDGVLTIITTNHINKVDPALGTSDIRQSRPGRVDRVVAINHLDCKGKKVIAEHILRDFPERVNDVLENSEKDTSAQFQEKCTTLALELYWNEKEKTGV